MGETQTAVEILDGGYNFPSCWDKATVMSMREAAMIKSELAILPIWNKPISVEDFRSFWKYAKEKISLSFSRRHFGHYKAASQIPALSLLHTTSLNLAAQ